jgi:hypothetical protein
MSYMTPTDWQARSGGSVDALDVAGNPLRVAVVFGSDDEYGVDLANDLDDGETLDASNVSIVIRQLASYDETEDQDVSGTCGIGQPRVDGTVVVQRVTNLVRGREYVVEVLHGAAGNKRGVRFYLSCVR